MKIGKYLLACLLLLGISFLGMSQTFTSKENFQEEVKKWILNSSYNNAINVAKDWDAYFSSPNLNDQEKNYLETVFHEFFVNKFNSKNLGFLFFRSYLSVKDDLDRLNNFNLLMKSYIDSKNKGALENLLINLESYFYNQTLKPMGNLYFRIGGKYELEIDSSTKIWDPILNYQQTNLTIFHKSDSLVFYFDNLKISLKTMDFSGINGEIEGIDMGREGETWKLNQFQFNAKESELSSYDSYWNWENESLAGTGNILLKEHKSGSPFLVNFKSSVNLSKPMEVNDYLVNGNFTLRNSILELNGENHSVIFELKTHPLILKSNGIVFDQKGNIQISNAIFKAGLAKNDSITHPNVNAKYNIESDILELRSKDLSSIDRFLYQDNHHKLQISADIARINSKENRIDFYRILGKDKIPAWVESYDYFNPNRVQYLTQELSFDPLRIVYNYFVKKKQTKAYLLDIAQEYNKNIEVIRPAFYKFRDQGYLLIEQPGDLISFTRVGKHYALSLFQNKDYDEFIVPSFSNNLKKDTANISVDLSKNELLVRGVNEINLSDSLNSFIQPLGNTVVFTEGRDFNYAGIAKVGNYEFFSQNSKFDYNHYLLDLAKIDSIRFLPKLADGSLGKTPVGGELQYESGRIELLDPNNKSSKNGKGAYPKLIIPKGVTAYFDQFWRANGAYKKDIYLKVPNIYLDSLLSKDLSFTGHFSSNGLINDFDTDLILQPDQGFGFEYDKSPNLAIYNKKGKIISASPLIMDKSGLHSSGKFSYKSLNTDESSIYIFPDSLKASGSSGKIEALFNKQLKYPEVEIKNHQILAYNNLDSIIIHPIQSNLNFYKGEFNFIGDLIFSEDKYSGKGKIEILENSIQSENFNFFAKNWMFKEGNLILGKGKNSFRPDIILNEVSGESQVGTKIININQGSNFGSKIIEYPNIAYKSEFQKGSWNWDSKLFNFYSNNGVVLSPYTYQSSDTNLVALDTNNFLVGYGNILAKSGIYDFSTETMSLSGVEKVRIGPSLIFPDNGKFGIKKGGDYVPFTNARAILDADNNRHFLSDLIVTRANPSIFKGAGNYLLARPSGDSIKIMFTQFDILGDPQVIGGSYLEAKANFGEKTSLPITKYQDFKGEILLKSNQEYLEFSGFIRPNLGISNFKSSWIPFEPTPGTQPILKVDNDLVDEFGNLVTVGIFVNAQNKLYPTFLGRMNDEYDPILFNAKGIIQEDSNSIQVIGEGINFKLNIPEKRIIADGPIELFTGNEFVRSFGSLEMSTDSLIPRVDTWLSLQFPFYEEVLEAMGKRIVKFNLEEGLLTSSADEPEDRDNYLNRVKRILKDELLNESVLKEMDKVHMPLSRANEKFNRTINFSKIHLNWEQNTGAFYHAGPMSLVNVGPVDVNNLINGKVEIIKRPSKEEFYAYFELSDKLWYYLAFFDGEMGVYSSDYEFLSKIRAAVQADKNKKEGEIRVVEAGSDEKDVFLRRFNAYYQPEIVKPKTETTNQQPTKTKAPPKKISKGGF